MPGGDIQTISGRGASVSAVFAWWLGNGLDGALVFDGVATVAGLAPVGNVYTMVQDINATFGTINVGVTVLSQNWRVFAQNNLTINGVLGCPGLASPGGSNNTTAGAGIAAGYYAASNAGAAGASGVGNLPPITLLQNLGNINSGAAGQGVTGNVGGGAGSITIPTAAQGGINGAYSPLAAFSGYCPNGAHTGLWSPYSGGLGGASGGGGNAGNGSSGGGGAAGMLSVWAQTISGTGTINMQGGASGQSTSVGVGGSNGGGGGILWVFTSSSTFDSGGGVTINISGGTFSNLTGAGVSNGVPGGVGRYMKTIIA